MVQELQKAIENLTDRTKSENRLRDAVKSMANVPDVPDVYTKAA